MLNIAGTTASMFTQKYMSKAQNQNKTELISTGLIQSGGKGGKRDFDFQVALTLR